MVADELLSRCVLSQQQLSLDGLGSTLRVLCSSDSTQVCVAWRCGVCHAAARVLRLAGSASGSHQCPANVVVCAARVPKA